MSIVDSGLGWKCDEKYYVSNAGALLLTINAIGTRNYNKYLDGSAICFIFTKSGSPNWTGPVLASTNPDYANVQISGNYNTVLPPGSNTVINGATWYWCEGGWIPKSEISSMPSQYPYFNQQEDGISIAERIAMIISSSTQEIPVQFEHQGGGVLSDNFPITVMRI